MCKEGLMVAALLCAMEMFELITDVNLQLIGIREI